MTATAADLALAVAAVEQAAVDVPVAFDEPEVSSPVSTAPSPVTGPGFTEDGGVRWRDAAIRQALAGAMAAGAAERVLALASNYDQLVSLRLRGDVGSVRLVPAADGERRRRGSFATPQRLAAELARRAVQPNGSVVDPACGAGALLRAALGRMLAAGIPGPVALQQLNGVDTDPLAVELCRASLLAQAGVDHADAGAGPRIVVGDALFPSVWAEFFADRLDRAGEPVEPVTGWRGGFDAVIANPPWERLKVFRSEGPATLAAMRGPRAEAAHSLRSQGRHPLTGNGELNTYLPFVETCWRLLTPDGRASILVPAGIAADRSAARLMAALLESGSLSSVQLLASGKGLFPGVSARVGVALIDLRGGPARETPSAPLRPSSGPRSDRGAEVCVEVEDPTAVDPQRVWQLDADFAALVNPNTHTIPTCASARDAELLGRAHRRWPVLRRHAPPEDPWQVRLVTPLHMTRDAGHFQGDGSAGLLPLWEAKQAGLLDHRGGSRPGPRYWVDPDVVRARFGSMAERGWLGAYRNVTTVDAPRTLLPCALPFAGVGNSLPLIDAPQLPLLLTILSSLPVDHLVRQKHSGANLNFFKLEQTAVPAPADLDVEKPWTQGLPISTWLLIRFAATQRWEPELAALASELEVAGVDVAAACAQLSREQALAEIDAGIAMLLDYDADDIEHVLASFPALRRFEERTLGEFRTGRLLRAAHRRLAAVTESASGGA